MEIWNNLISQTQNAGMAICDNMPKDFTFKIEIENIEKKVSIIFSA